MPVNVNNFVAREFFQFDIDTSNYLDFQKFSSNLSTTPIDWTREQWLRIICRTPEIKTKEYDKYLFYKRKLTQFEILPTQIYNKYQGKRGNPVNKIKKVLESKGFFTTSESLIFFSNIPQALLDISFFEGEQSRFSAKINTLEKKQQLFLAILANLFDASENGYQLEQTDFYFFGLLFNTFYNICFPDSSENNNLNGEFLMYYLFKKIFFDTKLYSFTQQGMTYITSSFKNKVKPPDDLMRYQYDISKMVSPHNIIPYLITIIFIKLSNSSKFKKLSEQNRNVMFNSLFRLFTAPTKYSNSSTGVMFMIENDISEKIEFFANFFINGEDVLYLMCLYIYPWRYINEQPLLKYILPSVEEQLSRHNNTRKNYAFKKSYNIGSSAEIIIQSPDGEDGETNVPTVRKFLAWALRNKVTQVPPPENYQQGLVAIVAAQGSPAVQKAMAVGSPGIKVNLSNLNRLYKYFTRPRKNGNSYINFFISFLKKNWAFDITAPKTQGHTICPPLNYLGKFKNENEPYVITPLPPIDSDGNISNEEEKEEKEVLVETKEAGAQAQGGGRIKNRTIKRRRKNKRKTLKLY